MARDRVGELSRVIETVQSAVSPMTEGIMVVGSYAYGKPDPNDMDFVFIVNENNLPSLLNQATELLPSPNGDSGDRLEERLKYLSHAQSFKGKIDGQLVSFAVYTPALMMHLTDTRNEEAVYLRETPNAVDVILYNISGGTLSRPITNSLAGAGLIIATEPNFVYTDNRTYIGVAPDAFLKRPFILQDRTGIVRGSLSQLWGNILEVIKAEAAPANYSRIIDTGRLPLIRKQTDFERNLYKHMQEQLRATAKNS